MNSLDSIIEEVINDDKMGPVVEAVIVGIIESLAEQIKTNPEGIRKLISKLISFLRK